MGDDAQKLTVNLVTGIVYQAIMLCANFFTKQAIRYQLGTDYLGLQTVFSNVSDVLIFAFGGLGLAMLYQLYKPIAQDDKPAQTAVFRLFNRVYLYMSLGSLAAGILASAIVLWSVNADISTVEVVLTYGLFLVGVVLNARYNLYYYFLMADQRRYFACISYSIAEILATVVGCALLYSGFPYAAFLICVLARDVFTAVSFKMYAAKRYPYLSDKTSEISQEGKRQALSDVKDLIIARVGMTLVNSTDSIIISGLVGTAIAGCYSGYYFIIAGVLAIVVNVYEPLMSRVGKLQASAGKPEIFAAFAKMYLACFGITALCVPSFYYLCEDFLTLWMGSEVLLPQAVLAVCAVNLYMGVFRQNIQAFRLSAGIFSHINWVIVARGVLNIIVSLILGSMFGVVGVLIATTICDLLTVYWFEPYLLYKHLEKPLALELGFQIAGALVTVCSFALTGYIAGMLGPCASWFDFLGKTLSVGLVSCLVPALVCLVFFFARRCRGRNHG